MKVIAYIVARNEGSNLPQVLEALNDQTLRPDIVFLDDASEDNSKDIAAGQGCDIVTIDVQHPSLSARKELAQLWNIALAHRDPAGYDYWIQCGADIILGRKYLEKITHRMAQEDVAISSGSIAGEHSAPGHVRGAGRVYAGSFWQQHIQRYPLIYGWESYPLFKAQALGFRTRMYGDLMMKPLRSTEESKPFYGLAMRQLGYWPPFALGRSIMAMLKHPVAGSRMLAAYLQACCLPEFSVYDPGVAAFVKRMQVNRLLQTLKNPRIMARRIAAAKPQKL